MVVRKSVLVACPAARAFEVFTREYARWWPFATHSIGEAETQTVAFEAGVGGRIYERTRAGVEHDWGRFWFGSRLHVSYSHGTPAWTRAPRRRSRFGFPRKAQVRASCSSTAVGRSCPQGRQRR
jgi:hypothetical protein